MLVTEKKLNLIKPEPYQVEIIKALNDKEVFFVTNVSGRQIGKAELNDNRLITEDGTIRIGDAKVGDRIYGGDGKLTTITGVYPQGKIPLYRVTFSNNTYIDCSGDHLWGLYTYNKKYTVISTNDMIKKGVLTNSGDYKFYNKVSEGVSFKEKQLLLDPYLLGVLLGDGYIKRGIVISNPDISLIEECREILKKYKCEFSTPYKEINYFIKKSKDCTGKDNPIVRILKDLNIRETSSDKFIPKDYLFSSPEQRLSLLQGLMDTDGYCNKNSSIEYTTVSKQLSDDFQFLCNSLGIKTYCRTRQTFFTYKGEKKYGKLSYRITLYTSNKDLTIFRVKRKQDRINYDKKFNWNKYLGVKSIVPIGENYATCISIDNKDKLYLTNHFIKTHNTLLAQNMALYWAFNDDRSNIYWVSPTDSQAQKVYKEISSAIYGTNYIKSKKMPKGDTEIVLKNRSTIYFRSSKSEDSLRGPSVDYLIIDEAAFQKESTINEILLPMMNVRGKKCLVSTTPKGRNWVYKWFLNGENPTMKNWRSFRTPSTKSRFTTESTIEQFRNILTDAQFQQEIMAEFVDSAGVFRNIDELCILPNTETPVQGEQYYIGIDIGLIVDATVIAIIDSGGNLVTYYRYTSTEAPEIVQYILDINALWRPKKIWIENNNQGLTIYQSVRRKIMNVDQFNTNQQTKPEIINELIYSFNTKSFFCIDDQLLRWELMGFIFKQNEEGRIKFLAGSGYSDDIVMALAIARENWKTNHGRKGFIGFR